MSDEYEIIQLNWGQNRTNIFRASMTLCQGLVNSAVGA